MLKTKPRPSLFAILTVFFGVLALASLSGLKHGFAPSAKAVLAISLGFAVAAAIYVIGREQGRGDEAETRDEDGSVGAEDEVLSYIGGPVWSPSASWRKSPTSSPSTPR